MYPIHVAIRLLGRALTALTISQPTTHSLVLKPNVLPSSSKWLSHGKKSLHSARRLQTLGAQCILEDPGPPPKRGPPAHHTPEEVSYCRHDTIVADSASSRPLLQAGRGSISVTHIETAYGRCDSSRDGDVSCKIVLQQSSIGPKNCIFHLVGMALRCTEVEWRSGVKRNGCSEAKSSHLYVGQIASSSSIERFTAHVADLERVLHGAGRRAWM
ncbi:hypothetical protein KC321_g49 [Hortaea werneckii]|nr:hypothetical protein KC321_g49 [Hortaea werneckii]